MSDYFSSSFSRQSVALNDDVIKSSTVETGAEESSERLALAIVTAALDRKAADILVLKVREVSYIADYFLMMTGYSRVQVRAIADSIESKIKTEYQRLPLSTEGKGEGGWVLQDYGDVIVHIMMPKEREFYNLEAFWGHAEKVQLHISDDGGSKFL